MDVLDLGIGYNTTYSSNPRVHYWGNREPRTEMSATRTGETYEITGHTYEEWWDEAGDQLSTWPVELRVTCPAGSH